MVAALPVVCVLLNHWLSMRGGYIPSCIPYLEGCTSISSTGRHGLSYWLFKAMMLPQAIVLTIFWLALQVHLKALGQPTVWMVRAGIAGAVFLVLYTVFLGSSGDIYRLMRRYGVFVFFLGTLFAQIIATRRLSGSSAYQKSTLPSVQKLLLGSMLLLALAEVPLGQFGLEDDAAENVIEWNFSLLMQLWFASWLLSPQADRRLSAR
ncbi:MAG: hypothetical protein AAFN07_02265 [Pseudomonadota bacterium]